ncbi:Smr/MutS family protein [Paraflavitalea sp. CAU 1676]|uniref:Smr/MutS family protein n=1 Tax=Paraflavitalea sp. CAU 1676 TaxID=3032598 RepID=UPI0023DB2874|nr:Smr/MutS family protein [Paraflavitalea sp. CAU 1676]MDF2191929.1 hypothetical protein [Paraflavitalea sp. CAU 1676]
MKFQIGDKVVVLHSNDDGEVVDIINEKMVMVDVRGVKFPAYTDQLDFPYFKQFMKNKIVPEKKEKKDKKYIDDLPREKKQIKDKVVDGVWITFIPVLVPDEFGDDVVEDLKVHLVNRTHGDYKFTYKLNYFGETSFDLVNQIRPFEDFYLHDVEFETLNDSPTFSFEFSLTKPDKNKAEYFESSIKLKPKQVFTRIEELKKKGEATFSYKLFDDYPPRVEEPSIDVSILGAKGFKVYDVSQTRQNLEPAKNEIDLHIEKLTPDADTLDNFEKLDLQIRTFEKYLDLAILHHKPAFIAIHGVGSGKLRDEIHEILKYKKGVKSFFNKYHPAYGYGATEIYFQY